MTFVVLCHVFYRLVLIVSNLCLFKEEEQKLCVPGEDSRGLVWTEALAGTKSYLPCQEGFKGEFDYQCIFFLLLNTCYICFKKQHVYLVTPDVSKTRQGQRNQKWTHTTVVYLTCQVLVSIFTDWH